MATDESGRTTSADRAAFAVDAAPTGQVASSTTVGCVVFDLGGVIVHPMEDFAVLAGRLGAPVDAFTEAYFAARHDYDAGMDPAGYWTEVAGALRAAAPSPALVDELVRFDDLGWNHLNRQTVRLVEDLERAGTRLALLSNAPSSMGRLVRSQSWSRPFDTVIVSAEVGVAKPDPAIFRLLLDELGLPARSVVFVDDRPENVMAAADLGLHGVVFVDATQARSALRSLGLVV